MESHREALRQLLERTRLREDEVIARSESASSPDFWKNLCPDLSLGKSSPDSASEDAAFDEERRSALLKKFAREGYFQTAPLFSPAVVGRMAGCIETLRSSDWPPVFSFVYDEFWELTRGPGVSRFLSEALGAGYKQIPHLWAHYVHPDHAAGWNPHTDNYRRKNRVTVWVALSAATLENGCIYLIPKNMAPGEVAQNFPRLESLSIRDVSALLQSSRALPVEAGAVLGWEHDVIHWGAACAPAPQARLSISQEFIGADEPAAADETPLLDARRLPTFAERLHVIAKAIVSYKAFEPLTVRYVELARRLLERVAAEI